MLTIFLIDGDHPRCSRGFSVREMHLRDHQWLGEMTMISACGRDVHDNYYSKAFE